MGGWGAYIPCQFDLLHHLPVSLFRVGRGFWVWTCSDRLPAFQSAHLSPVSGHRRSGGGVGGKRGCQEGEWRAKPVLTQHLKPPHKYRLPFPISKAAPSTSVYTLARRSVSRARGCEFKNDRGTSGEGSPGGGGALMCWRVRDGARSTERTAAVTEEAWVRRARSGQR